MRCIRYDKEAGPSRSSPKQKVSGGGDARRIRAKSGSADQAGSQGDGTVSQRRERGRGVSDSGRCTGDAGTSRKGHIRDGGRSIGGEGDRIFPSVAAYALLTINFLLAAIRGRREISAIR